MAETDPRLDQILEALGQLTAVVGALAQHVALADTGAGAPSTPPVALHLTQEDPYLDLVPANDDNLLRRTRLAQALEILGTPAGAALVNTGARGFYRGLERDEGQERHSIPRHIAVQLVEDALLEDPREAGDMGLDLLKIWEEDEDVAIERAPVIHANKVAGSPASL